MNTEHLPSWIDYQGIPLPADTDPHAAAYNLPNVAGMEPIPDELGNIQGVWRVDPDHHGAYILTCPQAVVEQEALDAAADANGTYAAYVAAQQAVDNVQNTLEQRLRTALQNLETAAKNWATLTAAQKDASAKLNVQATAALVRLYLRQLDSTG